MFHAIHGKTKEKVEKLWEKEDCYMDFVLGLKPEHQPRWLEIDFVYSPFNYKQHWILLVIDVNFGCILLYDSPIIHLVEGPGTAFVATVLHFPLTM